MILRRLIALLCTIAYLVAAGGTAVASLCCPCVGQDHAHTCCHHHTEAVCHAVCDDGVATIEAENCDDRHSNDHPLYTAGEEQNERRVFRASMQPLLVAPIASECTIGRHPMVAQSLDWRDQTPRLLAGAARSCALRAPPQTV